MSKTKKGLLYFSLVFAIAVANYIHYQMSPMAGEIMEKLSLDPAKFTQIFTSPMIMAVILSIVAGVLVDKFGARGVLFAAMFLSFIGCILRLNAGTYGALFGSMLLVGLGNCFTNANAPKIIGMTFGPEKSPFLIGVFCACAASAMFIGTATTALFPSLKSAYMLSVILTAISSILFLAFVTTKKAPTTKDAAEAAPGAEMPSFSKQLGVVLKTKELYFIGLICFCFFGCNSAVSALMPTALASKGMDTVTAGLVSSIFLLGSVIGSIIIPIIAAKTGGTKRIIFIDAIIVGIATAFAWRAPQGPLLIIALFIGGFCLAGSMPLLFAIPMRLPSIGPLYAGTAGGVVATLELLGAVLIPSYIAAPIAGSNFSLYFIISGAFMIIGMIFTLLLPKLD